jgi:hypothetical protein
MDGRSNCRLVVADLKVVEDRGVLWASSFACSIFVIFFAFYGRTLCGFVRFCTSI